MDQSTPSDTSDLASSGSNQQQRSCLIFATLAAICLVVGTFAVIGRLKQDLPPELTRESFDQHWNRWQENEPADYHIETEVVGPQPAKYAVDVRNHIVVSATRNGDPLPNQPRTMRTWSVPGMFDTMEHDVMRIEAGGQSTLSVQADFDSKWGYPARFFRNDYQNSFRMHWTVTSFVPGATAAASTETAE